MSFKNTFCNKNWQTQSDMKRGLAGSENLDLRIFFIRIDLFTVMCLVTWPLNENEAE